jgi:hyperosmotically inducible protein
MLNHHSVVRRSLAAAAIVAVMGLGALPRTAAAQDKTAQSGNVFKDGWITMKIHSQFIPEDALEGSNIDVDTTNGNVVLMGTVPTEAGRARAVAIAKATDGVKNVSDKLRIAPAGAKVDTGAVKDAGRKTGRTVNDGWIKSKIYAQFLTDWKTLDDSDIDIDVASGAVTLKGTVKTEAAKTRAVAIAKATDGVKSVHDSLRVVAK